VETQQEPKSLILPSVTGDDIAILNGEVEALHRRCGIYTKHDVVCRVLDAVDWRIGVDLSHAKLLEPSAGDGAFIVEAARRLIAEFRRRGTALTMRRLVGRIKAFELHPSEVLSARARVFKALCDQGVPRPTAKSCSDAWIVHGDFLLTNLPSRFTHVVGNPPYVRWSKIPRGLKLKYERSLPANVTGGDLFLPFLHKSLESLRSGGRFGVLCSDRWRYMGFATTFRNKWLPRLDIVSEDPVAAIDAFVRGVESYPTILIAVKRRGHNPVRAPTPNVLRDLKVAIRVGPALGHTSAYVLEPHEDDVEPELLHPWIDGSEVREGAIGWRGRRVVLMHGSDGKLITPQEFPMLMARLERFREPLTRRSVARGKVEWYRPIDRVYAADWARPKLLIPELAKTPRLAIDRSGAIPSHGVYAVFAHDDDIDALYEKLRDGQLAAGLENVSPKVKGGYVRCYARFLFMARIDTVPSAC
jgi:adenine-specific DNA-methyltransferase